MNSYLDWDLDADDLGLPPGSTADEMEHAFATSPPTWVTRVREWCALTGGEVYRGTIIAPRGMDVEDRWDSGSAWWSDRTIHIREPIKCRGYPEGASAETCVRIWCMRYGATIQDMSRRDFYVQIRLPEGLGVCALDEPEELSSYLFGFSWENLFASIRHSAFYRREQLP